MQILKKTWLPKLDCHGNGNIDLQVSTKCSQIFVLGKVAIKFVGDRLNGFGTGALKVPPPPQPPPQSE